MSTHNARAAGRSLKTDDTMTSTDRQNELERAREANRIHCKETRDRKRERERLLRQEVELLTLYKSIVEDGPDLFSLHDATPDAPFSFLCENFYQRLQLAPEDVIGRSLATIVDPRDAYAVRSTLFQVLNNQDHHSTDRGRLRSSGSLIHLRVTYGGVSCDASMTISVGHAGLVIVTRLYDA